MPADDQRRRFAELHAGPDLFLLPNPWDVGSAKLLAAAGFPALATTSAGFAWTLGRNDYGVTRELLVDHVAAVSAAVDVPLNVDAERCFADDTAGIAETVGLLRDAGAAGFSIEDWDTTAGAIDPVDLAVERVAAAAEAAHAAPGAPMILTARCEHLLRGTADLAATVERLVRYQEAGADCLYAPGLRTLDNVRAVLDAVEAPVNVLGVLVDAPVADLAAAGVRRVSVGGALASVAYGQAMRAARELLEQGTTSFAAGGMTAEERAALG